MKKRIFVAVLIILLLAGIFFWADAILPETYSTAKKSSEGFLRNNADAMEEIASALLREGKEKSGHYKDHAYAYTAGQDFVAFEMDSQGMLGGQYWSLIYTSDDTGYGKSERYVHEETDGNNIYIAERLDDHWWFLWTDYDGTDRSYK
ncbi:MAG: hypothetical protein IJY28_00055 [Clostridia bacterium]|nr:hypothetical protein [Clostridia bacterium]